MPKISKPRLSKSQIRTHAIGIATIVGVVLLLFVLMGGFNKPAVPGEVIGDRYIIIDSATWGRNCNPNVQEALNDWRLPPDASKAPPKPTYAQNNNVLEVVRQACNNHLSCTLPANVATLKLDTLPSCYKKLEVGYRCYAYDRLSSITVDQASTLNINCAEKTGQ